MRNVFFLSSILSLIIILSTGVNCRKYKSKLNTQNQNSNEIVPNEETAIKIAEAVWLAKFGERIYSKEPFVASLIGDSIWEVKGTLIEKKGGVPFVSIQKKDGKILEISHGK